jgi:hypothetical protein
MDMQLFLLCWLVCEAFAFVIVCAWVLGQRASDRVAALTKRLVMQTENETKWIAAGEKLKASLQEAHVEQWCNALAAAKVARDNVLLELNAPEPVDVLHFSIGDEIERFTCDGCDTVYRRGFPGYCTHGDLEFCSSICRSNPLPFDAPPVIVVTAKDADLSLN